MPQFVSNQAFNPAAVQADDLYIRVLPPPSFITGLPADILAIVGTAQWGPLNQPILLGSPLDMIQAYGNITAASVSDPFDLPTSCMAAFEQSQSPSSLQLLGVRVSDGTDTGATYALKDTTPTTPLTGATVTTLYTGTLGNQVEIVISAGTNANSFNVTVVPFSGGLAENYPNIPGSAGANTTFWANLAKAINTGMTGVRGQSLLVKITSPSSTALPPALGTFMLSGGTDGRSVTSAMLIGSDSVAPKTGIYSLRSLSTPPGLMFVSGLTDNTVYATIQAMVDSEGMMGILCLPQGTTAAAITAKQGYGIDDYNIIFVKDWVQWYDSTNGVTRQIQPSPIIGGAIACLRPDISPSNKPVYGVVGTERQSPQIGNIPYSEAEIGQLESNGIMFITQPCPGGNYWGMRHGQNSSSNAVVAPVEYSRMTNFLGHSLQGSLGVFVGQNQGTSPTDPTRAKVKATLDAFLQNLQDQGMIDSFLTICDLTNNTAATIAQHYLYADVMVRYMSSIHFFIVSLQGGTTVVTIQNVPTQSLAAA